MSETTPVMDAPSYGDIAAALATGGQRIDSGFDQAPPEPNTPAAPAEPPVPPETGTPTPPAAAPIPPVSSTPAPPVAAPQPAHAGETKVDWREEAKKADPSELMALLGFDDKLKGFVNKWKAGEDVTPYVRAASIDYSKMPPEEVMRHQLRAEFPELSEEDFQLVYESRVTNRYQLDPELFDEKQRKVGAIMLKTDADKVRTQLAATQQNLILNTKPPATPTGPTPAEQAEQAQQTRNWFIGEVKKDPLAAGIVANGKLTIGEGAEAFHYEIKDPTALFDTIADQKKMMGKIFDMRVVGGEERYFPKGDKQVLLGIMAEYGMDFLKEFGKHMRNLGAGTVAELIENSSGPGGKPAGGGQPELTPAQALAMNGQIVT
jgi:hypothetical protein